MILNSHALIKTRIAKTKYIFGKIQNQDALIEELVK